VLHNITKWYLIIISTNSYWYCYQIIELYGNILQSIFFIFKLLPYINI